MKKHLLLLALLWITPHAELLTLQESIDKTLGAHPNIKNFMLDVSLGEQNYLSARSAYLPQINLQAEYDMQHTYSLAQNGQFNTLEKRGYQAGVVAGQKIWDFSKTSSKIDAAQLDEEIAKLSVEEAKALLIYKVESLYATMIVQKKAILVRQKDMQTKQELYNQAQSLVKEGIKTSSDETRFLSSYYEAKDVLGVAQSLFDKAKSTLSLYMGEKISADVTLEGGLLENKKNMKSYDENLLSENNELKIQDQNIQKNILQHKSAKAAHYGSVDAVASYTHFDTLNAYDTTLVGVVLSVPLYSGGNISATEQMASIATNKSKELRNAKLLELQDELHGLFIDLERYENTIVAKQAQLEAAKSTEKVLGARYKEGLATYIELLDATTFLLSSELGLLEAYFSRSMAQNRIKYLTGKQI
ncbi:MAG: TolC family protein [Campylobacterales bacterium]|nr:TolC family protein [Campylobacterales bacterium]